MDGDPQLALNPEPAGDQRTSRDTPEIWEVGRQIVRLGDCLNLLKDMEPECIDVVVTSPPYNLGIKYNSYSDDAPRSTYLTWMGKVAVELARVLKRDGSLFLNVGGTGSDPWVPLDVASEFRRSFILQNHITWIKSISVDNDTVGHFKPITSRRFLNNNHEAIFHFTRTGHVNIDRLAVGVPYKDKSNISRWSHAKADRRCAGNTWFIPYETVRSRGQKYNHPAGFPVELPRRCIALHGQNEGVVLDPFLGAGTTLIAAQKMGLSGIGFEIDPIYAASSAARLRSDLSCPR